ncbi:MAG: hypothetical protein DHS20C21_07740 [Gemmatimonadota bacterium]|nr:MAG: hypothetical protein DHS20C21_07740 [Gemmatimonadota bacterium]
MAGRFMYASIGVLCLVAAYQLGVSRAQAEWSPESPGQLVGMFSTGSSVYVVSRSGAFWRASNDFGWEGPAAFDDLPVPSEAIAMLDENSIITKDDVLWFYVGGQWVDHGPFPGRPVSLDEQSWGETKSEFR